MVGHPTILSDSKFRLRFRGSGATSSTESHTVSAFLLLGMMRGRQSAVSSEV